METKETIIFEVDVTSYEKSLALLSNSINALKADQKAYLEDSKKGIAGAAEAYEKVTVQLKNQQQAYRTTQAALQGYVAGQKSGVDVTNLSNNSIQQNRDLLKQLTAQYINTAKPTEAFTKQIKSVSDALKQQEGAIGDTRRNVGNYAEGFKSALGSVMDSIPALKGFQTAQLGVNAAMDANPIGAVILLFQGLFQIMQQNKDVADKVSFSIDAITKAMGSVVDTIVDTVTNFDKFTQALAHPIDFIMNLGKGAAKAAVEGYKAAEALDALAEAQATANAIIESNNALIEKNVDLLKTINLSVDKRKKAAKEIADLEKSNAEQSIKYAQAELEAETLRTKGRTKSGEEKANLIKLQGKLDAAIIRSESIAEGYNRRLALLIRGDVKNTEKAVDDKEKLNEKAAKDYNDLQQSKLNALKKEDDERKKIEEKAEADRLAALSKNFQIENEFLQRQLQLDLTAVDLSVATEEEKERRKKEIQINSLERQLDLAIQFLGADGEITKTELQGIEAIKQAIAKVKQDVSKPTEKGQTLGDALGISKDKIAEVQNALKQVGDVVAGIGNLVDTIYQGRIQNIENENNAEIQAIEDSTASREEKDKRIKELNRKTAMETYEIQKQQFEVNKAISIVQTLINTAAAVVAQLANPTPYAGIALAALAAATGVAQVAVIASQQPPAPPKFAKGVIGLEGGGTETSDSIPALLSKNESVITAKATKKYHRELAWMEQSVGNTPNYNFAGGRFAGGVIGNAGFDTRQVSTSALQRAEMTFAIKEAMLSAPAPVVSVKEFNRVSSGVQRSVRVSEV